MTPSTGNTQLPNLPRAGIRATTEQLCTLYQISRTTWWRWSKAENFPTPLRAGRILRWDAEAVDAFLTGKKG
ncbi:helix-turn-helix domain-containing protein [Pseudomonas chlororaphis]|uniref:helix-turn-helix transcriptional regulator n=1 Tax=Pseudomonas chlororaphis TaxID=587753 RepID=UPI001232C1CD|nr:helix-turn-helix domain-containing protein [Pseudomonas chlororaphis]KAA5846520.1 helix-turn-helix domain-containing protein [Pseudomonas chlororaphis]